MPIKNGAHNRRKHARPCRLELAGGSNPLAPPACAPGGEMSERNFETCGPVVRTEVAEIARIVDVDGTGKRELMTFTRRIGWIREVSPGILMMHGDLVVKKAGGFCDVGRFLSSIKSAVELAEELAEQFSVTQSSSLSFVVEMTVTETPVFDPPVDPPKALFGRRSYTRTPKDWWRNEPDRIAACRAAWADPKTEWPESGLPSLEPIEVAVETIWSSANSPEVNAALIVDAKRRWGVTGPAMA